MDRDSTQEASAKLEAKRFRETSSQKRQRERRSRRNKNYKKKPVEITQQPRKLRKAFVGRVSFEWINGPKRGNKYSVMVTLQYPARLRIKGKELWVFPLDKEIDPYEWGGDKAKADAMAKEANKKSAEDKDREKRLRHPLRLKYEQLIKDHGPFTAGRIMAKGFVITYNKMGTKAAKIAITKLYGSVLRGNTTGHKSFTRAIYRAVKKEKVA